MAETRWGPALWGLLCALCCASVSGFEPNLLEEGIGLHVAQRLAEGERLYQDVLVFTGPFPFELLGGLFRVFGDESWVARSVVVAMHGLASAAAFALARGTGRVEAIRSWSADVRAGLFPEPAESSGMATDEAARFGALLGSTLPEPAEPTDQADGAAG
jgi:hypothetical protein